MPGGINDNKLIELNEYDHQIVFEEKINEEVHGMKERPGDESERVVKRKRFLFSVVIILLLSLLLSGCALGHSAWWKEEVLLHDGQTIIVDRSQKLGDYPYWASQEREVLEEKWDFPVPGTYKFVTWKINQELPPKGTPLLLVTIGFIRGTPYIATVPAGCISYNYWGRPNPPYVFFKYDGKTWQRIKLEEFPRELTEANVVVGSPKPYNRTGTISIAQIKEENRYLEAHLKKIARGTLSAREASEVGCPFEIYDGTYWRGAGSLLRQPSLEACINECKSIGIKKEYCPCNRLFQN